MVCFGFCFLLFSIFHLAAAFQEQTDDAHELEEILANKTEVTNVPRTLVVDIKSPKFQSTSETTKPQVKQAYAIQSQNDFHLECEINSQIANADGHDVGGELRIYWWFRSSSTNRSIILKRPQAAALDHPTGEKRNLFVAGSLNKMTIVSRIFIDCASREHEGEYVCAAFRGREYHLSKVNLQVLVPSQQGDTNATKKKSCETVSYKQFGPNPARIVEYTAVVFNLEFQDVILKCRTEKSSVTTLHNQVSLRGANGRIRMQRGKEKLNSLLRSGGGEAVKHVWLDNKNRQIRETSPGYKLIDNGDLIVRNLTFQQFGQFACITRRGNRIDSVSTFIFPIKSETKK